MTGINIKVRFGASGIMRCRRVTVDEDGERIDETDGESGGFGECDDNGVVVAKVTFEGYVRSADAAPPVVNDILANTLVAWDGNVAAPVTNKRHLFPKLKILHANRTGTVRGGDGIVYTLQCESSGTYKPMGVA